MQERGFNYARAEYYLQQNKVGQYRHEQTIICRQLFAGHVVCSRSMKRRGKNTSNDNLYSIAVPPPSPPTPTWVFGHLLRKAF